MIEDGSSRYELLDLIGVGGMAEVYRARMVGAAGFEKVVAIKRILPDFSSDEEFVRRFVDEARLTARLVHPNICQILDFGVMEGRHFIAMELVDGLDLAAVLTGLDRDHEKMPVDVVLSVASGVLRGLKAAHDARDDEGSHLGIVHRDVSPHNVLLSVNGDVKLSDLGAATANPAHRSARTQKHFRLGKVLYMAPEQRRVGPLDARADIYSTGILLTEMVLGATRFQKIANLFLAGLCTLGDQVLESVTSEIGRSLASVIERATAEDPDARYQRASEMLAVVEGLLADLAPGPAMDRVARLVARVRRRRDLLVASAGSGAGLVEGGSGSGARRRPPEGELLTEGSLTEDDEDGSTLDEPLTVERLSPLRPPAEAPGLDGPARAPDGAPSPQGTAAARAAPLGLDDVPTRESDVAPGPMAPAAAQAAPLGLDDVPTNAMGQAAAAEPELDLGAAVESTEPDTIAEGPPAALAEMRPLRPPPSAVSSSASLAAAESVEAGTEPQRRGAAFRGIVVGLVLGTALLAGLGAGALVATGRIGGRARLAQTAPSAAVPLPSKVAPDAASSPSEGGPPSPRPIAQIALAMGARGEDGGGPDASADAESGGDGAAPDAAGEPGSTDARRPRAFGFLNINSRPYGVPFVDGDRVGPETPVARLKVAAGRHRVKVFFPQEKRHRERTVRVRAGETTGVVIDLTED